MGLEKPYLGLDPGETFIPNSVSDLGSAETFQISRNVGLVIDENVCLLDSQPWLNHASTSLLHTPGLADKLLAVDFAPFFVMVFFFSTLYVADANDADDRFVITLIENLW